MTGEEGSLTPVGTLGFEICKLVCEGEADTVVHIAHHQKSFAIQQAMALSEIWIKRKAIPCCQVGTFYYSESPIFCSYGNSNPLYALVDV